MVQKLKKTFKHFVSEGNYFLKGELDKKFSHFVTDCSQYFDNAPKNFNNMLWRGDKNKAGMNSLSANSRTIPEPEFEKFDTTKIKQSGRTPKDTPKIIHDLLNEIFIKKFGYPFRDGVMATGQQHEAGYYGAGIPMVFVPANTFVMCYSPKIMDFFGEVIDMDNRLNHPEMIEEDELEKLITDKIKAANYIEGVKHLPDAIASNHEIMFYPKGGQILRYYTFSEDFWDYEISPRLKKRLTNP